MENIGFGIMLMVVGIVTVFAILVIIIYIAKALVKFVNKYIPEDTPAPKTKTPTISTRKMAAITSAVNTITNGKGKIVTIEKL